MAFLSINNAKFFCLQRYFTNRKMTIYDSENDIRILLCMFLKSYYLQCFKIRLGLHQVPFLFLLPLDLRSNFPHVGLTIFYPYQKIFSNGIFEQKLRYVLLYIFPDIITINSQYIGKLFKNHFLCNIK